MRKTLKQIWHGFRVSLIKTLADDGVSIIAHVSFRNEDEFKIFAKSYPFDAVFYDVSYEESLDEKKLIVSKQKHGEQK
jgi:hypothetical protein